MSTPQGPDQPRQDDPSASSQEQYRDPWYQQTPYQDYTPPPYQQQPYQQQPYAQQPYQQGPPPYPPEQYQPQQYDPAGYQPPYGNPQYGGQQYGYPQTAPKRQSKRAPLILATAAVLVVALAVVGIVLLTNGDDNNNAAQPPPATSAAAPSPSTSGSNTSPPTSAAPTSAPASPSGSLPPTSIQQITVPPVISGWHGVLSYKENVAYDVPPDWKVETPGTLVGFEDNDGQPIAIMHGVSTYKDEACPNVSGSYRGHTGFKTAGDLAPTTAARAGVKIFSDGVALKDDGSSAPVSGTTVEDITVDQGKIPAKYARATVALNDKSDCGAPSVVVVAVAFRSGPNATALFIGYFDQGVSDALPPATARKIFTTLRPYSG